MIELYTVVEPSAEATNNSYGVIPTQQSVRNIHSPFIVIMIIPYNTPTTPHHRYMHTIHSVFILPSIQETRQTAKL